MGKVINVLLRRVAVNVASMIVSLALGLWLIPIYLSLVTMVSAEPVWLRLPLTIAVGGLSGYANYRLLLWWFGGVILHGRRGIKKGQFGSVTVRSGGPGAKATLEAWGEGKPWKELSRE